MLESDLEILLKRIKSLEIHDSLDLSNKDLDDLQVIRLVTALAANPSITTLNLSSNRIDDKGAIALALNTSITTLNLSNNQIGDIGAVALAANPNITSLHLMHNRIGKRGWNALIANRNILDLQFVGNIIEFTTDSDITMLTLGLNQIGEQGAVELAKNTNITKLSFPDYLIPEYQISAKAGLKRIPDARQQAAAGDPSQDYCAGAAAVARIGELGAVELAKNTTLFNLSRTGNSIAEYLSLAAAGLQRIPDASQQAAAGDPSQNYCAGAAAVARIGELGAVEFAKNTTLFNLSRTGNSIAEYLSLAEASLQRIPDASQQAPVAAAGHTPSQAGLQQLQHFI